MNVSFSTFDDNSAQVGHLFCYLIPIFLQKVLTTSSFFIQEWSHLRWANIKTIIVTKHIHAWR